MLDTASAVDAFIHAVEAGDVPGDLFTDEVVLDATVPNWRFQARGREAVTTELRGWFADPGHFEEVRREPLPNGELVEFTLHWMENGTPRACHQAHILRVSDGRISHDTAFCGGRWAADLLARMNG